MSSLDPATAHRRSEFGDSVRRGVLLGLAALMLALPPVRLGTDVPAAPGSNISSAPPPGARAVERQARVSPGAKPASPAAKPAPSKPQPPRVATFGKTWASADARHVANWALHSGDHQGKAVVIVDKRDAKVFVFSPEGKLMSATPALLGSAVGDHTVPGVGDKPLSQVLPEERTTPAGRFVAEPGRNIKGEDIIWVDYDAAVSMHRVRPNVKAERRLQRLASATPADNRISFGCINLPVAFYEKVLSPTVHRHGAVVYVLPEVESPQALFGSYEVSGKSLVAQR